MFQFYSTIAHFSQKKKRLKLLFSILFFLFFSYSIYFLWFYDFCEQSRASSIPYPSFWQTTALDEEDQRIVNSILSKKLTYLGEGGQSYVFSTADDRYVLKLFKFQRLQPSWMIHLLPTLFEAYKEKHIAKRDKKLLAVFSGYKLAYDQHRSESGLLFVQLIPSHIPQWITLVDRVGIERSLDIGSTVCVIQRKGVTFEQELSHLLDLNNLQVAEERIHQVFALYHSEFVKKIRDLDEGVMHNIGFVEGQVFHLDVGKIVQGTSDDPSKQVASKIEEWIAYHYPQYLSFFSKSLSKELGLVNK